MATLEVYLTLITSVMKICVETNFYIGINTHLTCFGYYTTLFSGIHHGKCVLANEHTIAKELPLLLFILFPVSVIVKLVGSAHTHIMIFPNA